ncbi:MAG: NAD(P)-dependent dehydrogenase (short-subunit alcohol dehydrogenase family) [Arenicella sp.]|jgi:NAD(P)-dependent dehydrogenase (short-subunit alcohol dehydrogenase family)
MDPMLDFTGKTVLITGAASGFGKSLATELSSRGAHLVLGDIDTAGLDRVASDLGDNVAVQKCDVSLEKDCASLVALAIRRFGQLNIAVNNAGIAHAQAKSIDLTEEVFDRQMNVNVKSVMFGMKYQIPEMLKVGGGSILNVSSLAGILGAPKSGAYAAAKHAVVGLTRTAAVEYGRQNVRVNAVCPFFSPTNIGDGFLQDDTNSDFLAGGCPMKRIGRVEEMVSAMLMILSPANSFMSGQTIAIDGATTAI